MKTKCRLRADKVIVLLAVLTMICPGCKSEEGEKPVSPGADAPQTEPTKGSEKGPIRRSWAAAPGRFFTNDSTRLKRIIDGHLEKAETRATTGRLTAIVVPHAGYDFSGPTAAVAYKLIQGRKYDTVVVMGLSHRFPLVGASVYDGSAYESPLGNVPIDREMTAALLKCDSLFKFEPKADQEENSVEVQIPFLQRCLGEFKLVAVVMSSDSPASIEIAGRAIAQAAKGKNALLVASTDMTHFPKYEDAVRIDKEALEALKSLDILKITGTIDRLELDPGLQPSGCVYCGKTPLLSILTAAKYLGGDTVEILDYSNSGDVPVIGDKNRVVGYGAAAIFDTDEKSPEIPDPNGYLKDPRAEVKRPENGVSDEQRKVLLGIARASFEAAVKGEEYVLPKIDDARLNEHQGAFVTLTTGGELRGCIGQFESDEPIYKVIADRARASTLGDSRFDDMRLRISDIPKVKIEISLLNPLTPVTNLDEVEVGRHGLYVRYGGAGGTLLPQVASERGWDRDTFLSHTCSKAGLPADTWKRGAKFLKYTADVFGE